MKNKKEEHNEHNENNEHDEVCPHYAKCKIKKIYNMPEGFMAVFCPNACPHINTKKAA